jgi:hypothetical protein
MPLGLLDGVDWRMLEGLMRDAQLAEPAQQLGPVDRHGAPYSQMGIWLQPALVQMSSGVICRRGRASRYLRR